MHELAICEAIADSARRLAAGQRVEQVQVRIGYLRQVVPDSLQFSWELLTAESDLAGCELIVDHVPAVLDCRACGQQTTLTMPIMLCEACSSSDVTLIQGEEFQIVSLDRAQEVS
jgi:hydrogenase nickel incorporation protein HypA/HybF